MSSENDWKLTTFPGGLQTATKRVKTYGRVGKATDGDRGVPDPIIPPLKINMTMESHHYYKGDTSLNGSFLVSC